MSDKLLQRLQQAGIRIKGGKIAKADIDKTLEVLAEALEGSTAVAADDPLFTEAKFIEIANLIGQAEDKLSSVRQLFNQETSEKTSWKRNSIEQLRKSLKKILEGLETLRQDVGEIGDATASASAAKEAKFVHSIGIVDNDEYEAEKALVAEVNEVLGPQATFIKFRYVGDNGREEGNYYFEFELSGPADSIKKLKEELD